jgi:MFS superfamily sulfate permease-like transporter
VLRVEGGLFFANADTVRTSIKHYAAEPGTRAIVLDAESVPFIDLTAGRMLHELGDDLARDGQQLAIAYDLGQVRDLLRKEDTKVILATSIPEAIAALTATGPHRTPPADG